MGENRVFWGGSEASCKEVGEASGELFINQGEHILGREHLGCCLAHVLSGEGFYALADVLRVVERVVVGKGLAQRQGMALVVVARYAYLTY